MRSTKRWAAQAVGYAFLAGLLYLTASVAVFGLSVVLLQKGRIPANALIREEQQAVYIMGLRHIWQSEPGCSQFDADLLYKPALGPCHFANPEYQTVLNFDAQEGRLSPGPRPRGRGIAVIGDSHAMGWGVNDDQTFAALMQRDLKRPVYNLGVASYGTFRELQRLQMSGLLDKVDTIIIQYCDNDIIENQEKLAKPGSPSEAQYQAMLSDLRPSALGFLKEWVKIAVKKPIKIALHAVHKPSDFYDFAPHVEPLFKVLELYPWIKTKRVLMFYSNDHGHHFSNFTELAKAPVGSGVRFVDLGMGPEYYYRIDDHMTPAGHAEAAKRLEALLAK